MAEGYLLTAADRTNLEEMLGWFRRFRGNDAKRPPLDPFDGGAVSDIYIVRVPSGGIPALVEGVGTAGDTPGSAECDVYQILRGDTGLLSTSQSTPVTVYNLTGEEVVAADTRWGVAVRDKFGSFVFAGGVPTTADPSTCKNPLVGLRSAGCVEIKVSGRTLTAYYSTSAVTSAGGTPADGIDYGWKSSGTITTADGATTVIFQKVNGLLRLVLVGATTTWYGFDVNRCDDTGGGSMFAAEYDPNETAGTSTDVGTSVTEACNNRLVTVGIRCVPCYIYCGAFGPFPVRMCVDTASTEASPDDVGATRTCSFFYSMDFGPVTVEFQAVPPSWGTQGVDFPTTVNGGSTSTIPAGSGDRDYLVTGSDVRWFGVGVLTHATGVYRYGVEIDMGEGCNNPQVIYHLPEVTYNSYLGYLVQLRRFAVPFGTASTYPELPPVGSFPVTVPAASRLPNSVCVDSVGTEPCTNGITGPAPFVSCGGSGTFNIGPALVSSGACADDPGTATGSGPGEGGPTTCCSGDGQPLQGHPDGAVTYGSNDGGLYTWDNAGEFYEGSSFVPGDPTIFYCTDGVWVMEILSGGYAGVYEALYSECNTGETNTFSATFNHPVFGVTTLYVAGA